MPRSVAAAAARLRLLALRIPAGWRSALVRLALVWALLVAVFWREWTAMADQWWNVSTYNHILLIPAIVAWLVYERLHLLLQLDPRAWSPGPAAAAGAAFLWMLGDFSGLDTARQLGAVLVLVAATLTLLGPGVAAGLAFPLGYMLLLVPFGDELVAPLQMITAAITIGLVRLSGVPAAIDGVFINTPVGLFEVAEACSGVKFLIAMIAFGILVAGLGFRSWWRRAAFMLVCLIVPVLANGMRAWATVFAAQSVGAETAAGFDHIVYGWIFFALVIAFVLAISWRFFDRSASDPAFDVEWIKASPLIGCLARLTMPANAALAALGAVVLVAQLWGDAANRLAAPLPARIDLPPYRAGAASIMRRRCRGSRARTVPDTGCWAAMPMAPETASRSSSPFIRGRARGARPAVSGKGRCLRTSNGTGSPQARLSPTDAVIDCSPTARSGALRRHGIGRAIC